MTDTDSAQGRTLQGVQIDQSARIEQCKVCGQAVWVGRTAPGKPIRYDVIGLTRTEIPHLSTCVDARSWSRR